MRFSMSRQLDASIQAVWDAWTQAEKLQQWYSPGPVNWTIDELDVRPGGRFRMHMPGPNGEHVAEGSFAHVEPPTRLVQGPADGSMTIETHLKEHDGGTRMTLSMHGLPEEQHEMMAGAWNAGFDKLERLLAGGTPS